MAMTTPALNAARWALHGVGKSTTRATLATLALLLAAAPAAAQFDPAMTPPPPGGYAPGAQPQGTYPQGGQSPGAPQPAAQPPLVVRLPVFVHVLAGAWLPWPGTFDENHRMGGAADVMAGISLEPLLQQRLDVFVDVTVSRHKLEDRAVVGDQTQTTVASGYVGVRWFLTPRSPAGEPYVLAAAGLVYEAADQNAFHGPPQPSWISMAGAGWELSLGPILRLGARVTATYLDEGSASLGWVAPSLTLGAQI